ncbi:TauD/TfdA family dioxygenase [Streptomyces sp. OfavH-34-F]|uniref:TauD/TfdA family dioxygenase n=1 Tax=Streptomyces sp. OfavH-34-F TaxID=2917760 RepID=UPI001EF397B0|nr:TauD/TfdA family dioxygenase [Streptomyces sp. OfavH-34-F]MCG7524601.1 TauD/TfdA family dioxygenase [Streptomyces sp. OfavH-34-F]
MLDASAISETLFVDHYVNIRAPHAGDVIAAQLRKTGLVTLDGLLTRQQVLECASRLMVIAPHPHGAPDGLTLIQDTGSHAHRSGFAGLGNGELRAHTERSSAPRPPRLLLLVCLQPASAGGETLLADGRDVHARLADENREAAVALCRPRTACFGAGAGHAAQVFTVQADGRVAVRLRQDGLARWSPIVQPHLPALRSAIADSQQRLTLRAGQGYLLDNHRWLHARTRFAGDRRLLRALGDPSSALPDGFDPHPAAAVLPRTSEPVS